MDVGEFVAVWKRSVVLVLERYRLGQLDTDAISMYMFRYHPSFYAFPGTAGQTYIFRMNVDWINND